MKIANHLIVTAVILSAACSTGCKSTSWKMPGASLWSFNREPDAATLAGEESVPDLPESPASKYSPTTVASVGAQTSGTDASTGGNAYGYTAQTVSTPKAGLAAQANGYQTGPYQVGTNGSPSATSTGLPNPYGGSYNGASPTAIANSATPPTNATNTQLPSGTIPSGPTGYPGAGSYSGASAYSGTTNVSGSTGSSQTGLPAYPSLPGTGVGTTGAATQSYPALPPQTGYGTPSATNPAMPSGTSTTPQSSAYQGAATGSYAPGTTGRPNSYNFGTGSSLPPNTASGPGALMR